jgi:hypothetical protein
VETKISYTIHKDIFPINYTYHSNNFKAYKGSRTRKMAHREIKKTFDRTYKPQQSHVSLYDLELSRFLRCTCLSLSKPMYMCLSPLKPTYTHSKTVWRTPYGTALMLRLQSAETHLQLPLLSLLPDLISRKKSFSTYPRSP